MRRVRKTPHRRQNMTRCGHRSGTTRVGGVTGAEGRARTDTEVALQQFLRLPRLPIPPLRLERKTRFELATSSLARRHSTAELLPQLYWCRGGDLNSYGLAPTTPSRWRVYLFHHLGTHTRTRFKLAGVGGFEPPTGGFGDRCSTRLSYTPPSTNLP